MLWSRVVGGAMDGGGIGRYLAVKNMGSRVIHETKIRLRLRDDARSARGGRVLISQERSLDERRRQKPAASSLSS